MGRMERLYTADLAVVVDDGNNGGGVRGGKASAPGSDGIAHINCQAVAVVVMAAVEEEEGERAVGRDGNCAANGNGGPVAHGDRKDGDKSAAPCNGMMTTTTTATAMGVDWDSPVRCKLDHRNNGAFDCYRSDNGGKIWDNSGGSGGSRGGENSNRR
jgi:hypothetical protein